MSDGIVTINGEATVQVADVVGTNGVIHIIDAVLIPAALGGGIPSEESDATITLDNVGQNAWNIVEIEGEGADGELNEDNAPLTLDEGLRFTVVNLGANNHPFELRNGDGDVLIAAEGDGSLQDYEPANVEVNEDDGSISFTLTGDLAAQVATYNCRPHGAMEGELIVN